MNLEEIFKLVQSFLKTPPTIIWGSGATADFGLPTVQDLAKGLKELGIGIDPQENLEKQISEIYNEDHISQVKKYVCEKILEKDMDCLKRAAKCPKYLEPIKDMIKVFCDQHPGGINLITTNYDRLLEYAIGQMNLQYRDGCLGRILSKVNAECFKDRDEKSINLIKVHGSLNWSSSESNTTYLPLESNVKKSYAEIILPTNEKYQKSHSEPYRSLLTQSDQYIDSAASFFVVGFGFQDEHITPKLDSRIREGVPIVIITKEASQTCKKKIGNAEKYCLFEKKENMTFVTLKRKEQLSEESFSLSGDIWKLSDFMKGVFL